MKEVQFTNRAKKDLKKLNPQTQKRILSALKDLIHGSKETIPLTGDLIGYLKLRVGDHRIILSQNHQQYIVQLIRHRSEVYKTNL